MTRVLSALALGAAALAALLLLPVPALRWVAIAVAALAAHEYTRIAGTARGISEWVVVAAVAITCWFVASDTPIDPILLLLVALAWVVIEVLFFGRSIQQAAVAVIGPAYIGVPFGMLVLVQGGYGVSATILLIATIVVSDSGQYYSGRAFGRRPLAPAISPKKTVEGAIGGALLGTIFFTAAGSYVFPRMTIAQGLFLGVVIAILGICGDLFESRLKRASGIKDSSALIPGHGGVLDRVDALLFAIPVFYLHIVAFA
jgi:phosphatidate cytidylyltransferase